MPTIAVIIFLLIAVATAPHSQGALEDPVWRVVEQTALSTPGEMCWERSAHSGPWVKIKGFINSSQV